jgi:hypothetical protein
VCATIVASAALALCLSVGQGLRISASPDNYAAANSDSQFANSNPIDAGVASLQKQIRIPGKAPRRQVEGMLPPGNTLDRADVCIERSRVEVQREALTTLLRPGDRAPPRIST